VRRIPARLQRQATEELLDTYGLDKCSSKPDSRVATRWGCPYSGQRDQIDVRVTRGHVADGVRARGPYMPGSPEVDMASCGSTR